MKISEKKREITHLIKNLDIPPYIDKWAFGEIYLNNLINKEVEREMNMDYDDFFGVKNKISEEYDLGEWEL